MRFGEHTTSRRTRRLDQLDQANSKGVDTHQLLEQLSRPHHGDKITVAFGHADRTRRLLRGIVTGFTGSGLLVGHNRH